jgi:Holliday junction resolvase-like predicted endonuclease
MFKPSLSKKSKSNRRLYLKGWYYEQIAKKILYKKMWDEGAKGFILKAPYGYPFDLIAFIQPNTIVFIEVRYVSMKNWVFIPSRKISKVKEMIKGYNGWNFKYIIIAFKGGKNNYKIEEVSLKVENKKIII